MQRRRKHNTKRRFNLHSIPILLFMKNKSNVLYSIPGQCPSSPDGNKNCKWSNIILPALLITSLLSLTIGNQTFAGQPGASIIDSPAEDALTITPVSGGTILPPTASLSLSQPNMTSNAVVPGEIATANTNVTVSVSNASNYSLTLKVGNTNITNGNTTLTAGNPDSSSNVWGYKWDNASTYTAPTTAGTSLTVPALTSGSTSFVKTLTFGAKFGSNANAGTYHGSGTISLVAAPGTTTNLTLADLTQMQQLSLVPEACANTPYISGKNYSETYTLTDVRDKAPYTVAKLGDGKCWMTSNLKLGDNLYWGGNVGGASAIYTGRNLNPTTTDISSNYTLPASSVTGFSSDTASNVYYSSSTAGGTGYYTWCAATAGTCSSTTTDGAHASSSICPKGWRLPGGNNDEEYGNEFYFLFTRMDLGMSLGTDSYGTYTFWTDWTAQQTIVQGLPYNFSFTGHIFNSSLNYTDTNGNWWSGTAKDGTVALYLVMNKGSVFPGTNGSRIRGGYAVRCVAS